MILALLLAAMPGDPGVAPTRPFATADAAAIDAAHRALAELPAGWPRTRAASHAMLGTPYLHSPLGEGAGAPVDPDPRVRFDHVDCVTFVEQSLALGHTNTLAEATALLDRLRYEDGKAPSFGARLHFFEAEWLPAMRARGYLEEATRALFPTTAKTATVTFTQEDWEKRTGFREFPLAWADAPHGTFSIDFLPLAEAQAKAQSLPDGLVLSIVREERPGDPTIVSHVGLVVVAPDGSRLLRHAALSNKTVIDEPIEAFLRRHAEMKKWPVRGVNLAFVRDGSRHAKGMRK